MPYCLIGKIFVWGVLPLAYIFFSIWSYSELAHSLRGQLLGSRDYGQTFWIEDVYHAIRRTIGFLLPWDNAFAVWFEVITIYILSPFLNTLGFLELGLRYAIHRLRRTTTPTALA